MSVIVTGDVAQAKKVIEGLVEPDEVENLHLHSLVVLAQESSPRLAFAHLKLSCPELVNYRGGWFLALNFSETIADAWFERDGATIGDVEAMLNHIHIQQDTFGAYDESLPDMSDDEALTYGNVLSYQWKSWARDAYNLDIDVFLFKADDGYGDVQIWFKSKGLHKLPSETL